MTPPPRLTAALLVALMIFSITAPALAQGLDQTLEWPEVGFAIDYPAGWGLEAPDEQTRVLLSEPGYDVVNSDTPPSSPTVIILALSSDITGMMSSPQDILTMFAGEFGTGLTTPEVTTVAGYPALRVSGPVPDMVGFNSEIVIITADNYAYLVAALTPADQNFSDQFTAMLETVAISAPAGGPAPLPEPVVPVAPGPTTGGVQAVTVPVNAVRVSLDQRITGSWNEIDAVELVGADATGAEIRQWAIRAEATSEYTSDSWSAQQASGAPNTPTCGDSSTAWASASSAGQDSLTLYYATPVVPTQINIYETYNPGAIVLVEALPADGSAPIVAFSGVDPTTACPGVFSVSVAKTPTGGEDLTYGAAVSGSITNASYAQDWTFAGNAGDVVTITMQASSGDLDPYLYLLNAAGHELAYNDDAEDASVGSYNAQIAGFTLPASGTYTIRATRFAEEAGSSTGNYRLRLESGSAAQTGVTVPPAGAGAISLGETVTGQITNTAYQQDWTFDGVAGDMITITMNRTSGDLDCYLSLLDSAGLEIASNDDATVPQLNSLDSQISLSLPVTGRYTIRATRYSGSSGSSTGTYALSMNAGSPFADAMPISINQTVTGEITNAAFGQAWSFTGEAGQIVVITMRATSGDLDTTLYLLSEDGTELAYNDDAEDASVGGYNSQIVRYILPVSGTYYIYATRYGGGTGSSIGAYELTLALSK